ncbi:unnamed protein product [Zymoseptoria tritici ST99CH_1A5]|uniref:Manganese lipoxygenase n=2 Tax=Zymoseptoria tritici TaxID=1047171 RepID=A0A1X7RYA4_ZYMT9|nr:unnamed protein product [Zymoseptoria tritici ST99CH_3D7]SMR57627.1 unnamed protein product [Zymoseptoria tritici ST99CH_3D1]SMY26065.1 unnamed protein product [Zymoseptoria tritici ST99CH_1A5]
MQPTDPILRWAVICGSLLLPVISHPLSPSLPVDNISKRESLPYTVPKNDNNPTSRAEDLRNRRDGWLYGPPVLIGPWSAAGTLGEIRNKVDTTIVIAESANQRKLESVDYAKAKDSTAQYNGLATLDDYTKLYDREWELSSAGDGPALGLLTNYTQDLLFSMERLSLNPYAVRRLGKDEPLPFEVPIDQATSLVGQTASQLLHTGRLFYVDHRNQSSLPRATQYSANCDALFYISPVNGDFLPLAIRTNTGSNLIYTPADAPDDWLLAKMMFNVNDFFMGQWDHLSRTHLVLEAAGLAAQRTMSGQHPLLGLLDRVMYATFGFRTVATEALLAPGAGVDKYFGLSGAAAGLFSNETYFNGYASAVQANYFHANLKRRGLIESPDGPELKHFPYYEDAKPLYDAIRSFTGIFCDSYYDSIDAVDGDVELQAWLAEADTAQVFDFPTKATIRSVSDLADLMAHFGFIASIAHHTVNLNELLEGSGVLPFHPIALYKPVPDAKGVTDVVSYLPGLDKALATIDFSAKFARPQYAGTNRTLVHMFDSDELLARSHPSARVANEDFKSTMYARSEAIKSRKFGPDGLSQGMPFVWKALDPDVIAWNVAI